MSPRRGASLTCRPTAPARCEPNSDFGLNLDLELMPEVPGRLSATSTPTTIGARPGPFNRNPWTLQPAEQRPTHLECSGDLARHRGDPNRVAVKDSRSNPQD